MKIMALGDSLTDGWTDYSNTSHGGYRITLDAKLDAAGTPADFVGSQSSGPFSDNQHEGYPGQTIDWLVGKAHTVVPIYKPDMILLMAGANDTKTDSVATMKSDMNKLIDTLTHDAPNAIILVAAPPPPRPGNLSGHNVQVANDFNAALPGLVASKAAAGAHVQFVDTSSLTINDITPIGPDRGTHLTQAGYEKLANIWFNAVEKVIKGGSVPSTPVDHGVVASDDSATTKQDTSLVIKVLGNDSAQDGGLKLSSVDATTAHGGKVVMNSDGSVTYTPKAGYTGTDTFKYVAKDADGDTDGATVALKIDAKTAPSDPTPPSGGGTGHGVTAGDDKYTMDAGKKLYFNTSHILLNDKGADGGLKATVADKSASGVTLEKWADGTIVYKAGTASGSDKIDYVLTDKDGSKDVGSVLITIKNGVVSSVPSTPSSPTPPTNTGDTGKGNPVIAGDDNYKIDGGKNLYFNTRYLTANDKGLDGGLHVTSVDAASDRGVHISWGPEGSAADGTLIYKAPVGFEGVDKIHYTVVDKDGSSDIGTILVHVHDTIA